MRGADESEMPGPHEHTSRVGRYVAMLRLPASLNAPQPIPSREGTFNPQQNSRFKIDNGPNPTTP